MIDIEKLRKFHEGMEIIAPLLAKYLLGKKVKQK